MPQLTIDSDLPDVPPPPVVARDPISKAVFVIGSAGLLVAASADALAVLGRHTGFRLLGSIEIVQFAVVVIASAAVVGATLQRAHAAVHLITSRLSPNTATRLARFADVLSACAFLATAIGSIWVASDLWNGFEQTELLRLPLRPFRLVWIAATLASMALFVRHALRRSDA